MKNKKTILLMIGSLLVSVLLVIAFIKLGNTSFKSFYDKDNYLTYLHELKTNDDVHSGLFIFPQNVNTNNITELKYFYQDGIFDGSYLFYVVINYSDEGIKIEENRLKNINVNFGDTVKKILYASQGFNYPAYVTICDGLNTYEYALIDRVNKRVIYLFDQLFYFEELGLSDDYSPFDYIVSVDKRDYRSLGYNMYYNYDKFGTGRKYNEK